MLKYKTMEIGQTCCVPFSKNPHGKIMSCIRYARKVGKYFLIEKREKALRITRVT